MKSDIMKWKNVVMWKCILVMTGWFWILAMMPGFAQDRQMPVFRDGDRVCFVGNSITNNGLFYNYLNLYYATRYPDRKVTFINCGISGDVAQRILDRMESDILVHKPTWSVLMVGMNDVSHGLYAGSRQNEAGIQEKKERALELYRQNLELIIVRLLEGGRKLILQKPTIYDETAVGDREVAVGINDALRKCAHITQVLADKYSLPVVDYWTLMTGLNAKIQARDPAATIIGKDRVHPGAPGHLVMAYGFLKATGGSTYVSRMSIRRGASRTNRASVNVTVSDLSYRKEAISFKAREGALPFPVSAEAAPALDLIPFSDEFNQELLRVADLPPGRFDLFIDGEKIGTYPAEEFRSGLNLSFIQTTPQYRQAVAVRDLLDEYRREESYLRTIKTVEIHHLPSDLQDTTLAVQEAFLNKRFGESYANSPSAARYQQQFRLYSVNKPRQKEIGERLSEILELVAKSGRPREHTYKIARSAP